MAAYTECHNVIPLEYGEQLRATPRTAPKAGGISAVHARTHEDFPGSIGHSAAFLEVLDMVRCVAPTGSTVLIEGETGTGKESIAHAVHRLSPRRHNAYVTVNCAAIPAGLLESELFGHERGAFTGAATRRIGRFEAADGGTLFLDEVGDMPLELQAKLLRVLQEREFERVGSTLTVRADVRVVAATNQHLAALVAANQFRSDLYYRLNVFPIALPPLRRRPQDIPLLVRHFVAEFAARMGRPAPRVADETMENLVRYAWPGNIRELRNVMERAVILTRGATLQVAPMAVADFREPVTLEDAERDHIRKALVEANWVVGGARGAAARLGLKRTTLISKIGKLGVRRAGDGR